MTFQVSPGVAVREIDKTNVIPAVSTSIGGTTGAFRWGPAEAVTLVSSEKDLGSIFGTPTLNTNLRRSFLVAADFLKFGNALKVTRAIASGNAIVNAFSTEATDGVLIKNADDYDQKAELFTLSTPNFIARYPGELGNSIGVSIASSKAAFEHADFADFAPLFDTWPESSAHALAKGSSNDELHVVVYDTDGKWTGTAGTVLETFEFLSQARDAKQENGTSNYFKTVINATSEYIWVGSDLTDLADIGDLAQDTASFTVSATPVERVLSGGTLDSDVNDLDIGDLDTALVPLKDTETEDVNLVFAPALTGTDDVDLANKLIEFSEQRKDSLSFASPDISRTAQSSDKLNDVLDWANALQSSSYVVFDSTAHKVYDKYNDEYVWIPTCGQVAGLCANTDQVADAWFSPAGYNRGQLRGSSGIAFNPNQAERDALYKARVNPIVSFPGQGTLLYGDKTGLSRPSAFDRINVRRLFIILEKAISTAAKYQLFELNDEFTRASFRNMVEPFLRDVQGRRGMTDFLVVCDETNNTGQVISSNSFVGDIYIKPNYSINFITLNFVATRAGVEFSEVVGQ